MTIEELHTETKQLLTQQARGPVLGREEEPAPEAVPSPNTPFNIFQPSHLLHALAITRRFMEIANATPGNDGLEMVLAKFKELEASENLDLLKYALLVFITHHPEGRRLPIPPLQLRSPQRVAPSNRRAALGLEGLGGLGPEALLDYFREDTAVNDHHGKWHVVYPQGGVPDPAHPETSITKDRQGELFWYMHEQMLARYDADRLALGLGAVVPFDNYRARIAEGYDANIPGYSSRPANAQWFDLDPSYTIADHETRRDRLRADLPTGKLQNGDQPQVTITADLLGDVLEANIGTVGGEDSWSDPRSFYGNLHNLGHVFLASARLAGRPKPANPGVMMSTETAVRDPIFFRWHRHVDDLFVAWQNQLPSRDFTIGAPAVQLRKHLNGGPEGQSPDILFAFEKDIPGATEPGFDGNAYAEATFGAAHWDDPLASFPMLTSELRTRMGRENILLPDGTPGVKPYLDHDEFYYFLRMENTSPTTQKVTARVFIVPTPWADDRRKWVELDKFVGEISAGKKAAFFRKARWSSVVRKPAVRPSEPVPTAPPGTAGTNYCDCGWPYHLLLPRGNAQGMPFRIMVVLTDFQQDLAGSEKKCGSMSFCGARDAKYPDRQPMGYPFDAPFRQLTITQTIAAHRNMAARDFTIRHA